MVEELTVRVYTLLTLLALATNSQSSAAHPLVPLAVLMPLMLDWTAMLPVCFTLRIVQFKINPL